MTHRDSVRFFRRLRLFAAAGLIVSMPHLHAEEPALDSLLGEYAQELDLSEATKKESGGFLMVYTRQDLDRLQIRQLKELIEKIPFFRYREDKYGLSDPFYSPYQPPVTNGMRIYINDRAITNPFSNNGMRLFGQMDMGYIDHVEIYLGIPSQTFGIEGAACVVKLYTKDPAREQTDLAGALLGSRGTQQYYGYSAHQEEKISYLAYGSYFNLRRQNVTAPAGNTLKRDKEFVDGYAQIATGHHRFEFQALSGQLDAFLGDSMNMTSVDPSIDIRYLYGGWFYDNPDTGWKAFAYITDTLSDYRDRSPNPLGVVLDPIYHMPRFYYRDHTKLDEQLADIQLKKSLDLGALHSENGLQARYKHFTFDTLEFDGVARYPGEYDTETIYSLFSENNYLIDANNILVAALKIDRYIENGGVSDHTLYSGRVGYIYNDSRWTSKTFLMYNDAAPAMQTYFLNRYLYRQTQDPRIEHGYIGATKLIRKMPRDTLSGMVSRTILENATYFNPVSFPPGYDNFGEAMTFDSYLVEYEHRFDALNVLKSNAWTVHSRYRNGLGSSNTYGFYLSLTNTLDRFDIHNDLVYKYYRSSGRGLDWNFALTYHHSRRLTLFLKANNILGEALKQNYFTVNPFALNPLTELKDVSVFDKRVWAGWEYQF